MCLIHLTNLVTVLQHPESRRDESVVVTNKKIRKHLFKRERGVLIKS